MTHRMHSNLHTRRSFLRTGLGSACGIGGGIAAGALSGLGGTALSYLLASEAQGQERRTQPGPDFPPTAKRAIWLFMAGGPSQLDLFDYKPGLAERFGEELPASVRGDQRITGMTSGQAQLSVAPSIFPFAQGGDSGAWVSDLLPWTRKIVDDIAIVKTVNTEQINHDPAVNFINTGAIRPGKPSLGAWVSYGLGRLNEELPTYAVMTSKFEVTDFVQALSSGLWGSAFLPAQHSAVPIRGVGDAVLYLNDPPGVSHSLRRTTLDTLSAMNAEHQGTLGHPEIAERTAQYESAFQLQAAIPDAVNLSAESASTKALYGPDVETPGSFAANCLMARRMLEKGVRFAQIYHRGWDSHRALPNNLTLECRDVDQACYGLITDLKQRGMLEDTLVIWGGEFGRTVYCQGELTQDNYGRDHHGRCFTMWLAGGGIKPGIVYGETDDYGYNVVQDGVHVRDLHATILHCFGLDHETLTFSHQGLNERLVGVAAPAMPVTELLA